MEILSSPANPLLRSIRHALHTGTFTSDGSVVAEGPHLVQEALRANADIAVILFSETASTLGSPAFARLATHGLTEQALAPYLERDAVQRLAQIPDKLFADITATERSQGVVALIRPTQWRHDEVFDAERTPLLAVLDAIQDPGNAGTIIRTAEAFGATGAIFLKGSVNPYNAKCLRGSAGSVFRLPLLTGLTPEEFLAAATEHGLTLFAASAEAGVSCIDADFTAPCAIIVGSEGRGVAPVLSAAATGVHIPMRVVESLNAGIASAVLLYEAQRQRGV